MMQSENYGLIGWFTKNPVAANSVDASDIARA